ncbi:MAG: hypothetical protein ACR5LF_13240 [Symbiopectobacterium sp.]
MYRAIDWDESALETLITPHSSRVLESFELFCDWWNWKRGRRA